MVDEGKLTRIVFAQDSLLLAMNWEREIYFSLRARRSHPTEDRVVDAAFSNA